MRATEPGRFAPLLILFLVALGVRAGAWALAWDALPQNDEQTYLLRAEALLDGEGYLGSYQSWVRHRGNISQLPQYPGAYQPPGYPTFMAGAMALFGRSANAVRGVQVLLSAATVLLVYALGRAWFDHRRGLLAAWLVALYPNLIAYSHYLWSETLYLFLSLAWLWLLCGRAPQSEPPSPGRALLAGLSFGLAALTRGSLVWFAPALCLWLLWTHRERLGAALRTGALVCGLAALLIAPWSIRNTKLHGGFVLIDTNGPYNLWRGNTALSFKNREGSGTPTYDPPFDFVPLYPVSNRTASMLVAELKRRSGNDRPTDLQVTRFASRRAWAYIREEPGIFFARMRWKLVDMWNPTSFLVRHFHLEAYGPVSERTRWLVSWSAVGSYLLLCPLGLVGLLLAWRRPGVQLAGLQIAFYSAISATAFGLTRFRLPVMPLILLGAAHALLLFWEARRRSHDAHAAAP